MKVRARCNVGSFKKGKIYEVTSINQHPESYVGGTNYYINGRLVSSDWFVVVPSILVRLGNFLTHNH